MGRSSEFTQEIADAICERIADGEVAIYALCCPYTKAVKYIGKAKNPLKRLAGHLREKRGNTPKINWVQKCLREGVLPELNILAWVPIDEWKKAEQEFISKYRLNGNLLNVANGGDEPFCPKDVRADNGRKNAISIHSDPNKKRIWMLKRQLGHALKNGDVSDQTKARMKEAAVRMPHLFSCWANI